MDYSGLERILADLEQEAQRLRGAADTKAELETMNQSLRDAVISLKALEAKVEERQKVAEEALGAVNTALEKLQTSQTDGLNETFRLIKTRAREFDETVVQNRRLLESSLKEDLSKLAESVKAHQKATERQNALHTLALIILFVLIGGFAFWIYRGLP